MLRLSLRSEMEERPTVTQEMVVPWLKIGTGLSCELSLKNQNMNSVISILKMRPEEGEKDSGKCHNGAFNIAPHRTQVSRGP